MNRFKKNKTILLAAVLFTAVSLLALAACSGGQTEYESIESFEYHFYPEEYEEDHAPAPVTFSLDEKKQHQFRIDAACESGAMEIGVLYGDESVKLDPVSADAPCNELLTIPANTAGELTVTVSITPDTKGEVIGVLLAPAK